MKVLWRRANQKALKKNINTNKEKYSIDEKYHEEHLVTDNPVINGMSYFNLFECGKNILNSLDAMFRRACMKTSKENYYTGMYKTLTDYNGRNNTLLSNKEI